MGLHFFRIALVVRDWKGSVVLAMSKKAYTTSPLQAEAKALLWASQVASNLDLDSYA